MEYLEKCKEGFCECETPSYTTEFDSWGYYPVCTKCNKTLEDDYTYNSDDYLEEQLLKD